MSKPALTDTQQAILSFIEKRCELDGSAPSYREIQQHFGYSAVGTVQDHVRALRKKGFLTNQMGQRARNLLPTSQAGSRPRRIPVYGEIAAGTARLAEQIEIGSVFVPTRPGFRFDFALRVTGDSMIDAGIYDGDIVVVEKTGRARPGELVVALIEGETTVKRYHVSDGKPVLEPANPKYAPIALSGKTWSVQGRVVALQRMY